MTLTIDRQSFALEKTSNSSCGEVMIGTVSVTLKGVARRVEARLYDDGRMYVSGIVGRYRTGKKLWHATVRSDRLDNIMVHFGRDERQGRCVKTNDLFFA